MGPVMPKPPEPPPEPKAPPIPLKFYGFVNKTKVGDKRAFFLDGEDIVIAAEGDTIKKRYKIVRIGVNSAVVEDTEFKSNNQQTLPLEAELAVKMKRAPGRRVRLCAAAGIRDGRGHRDYDVHRSAAHRV